MDPRLQPTDPVRALSIEHEDRLLAVAVGRWDALHGSLHGDLHVEPGHLPVGTRTRLVDEFLDLYAKPGMRLQVTLPAGDAEILQRLRERCSRVTTRRAGATSLVDASVRPSPAT